MAQRLVSEIDPSLHQDSARENENSDLPLSRLLFRYIWPFWLFKDASRGDRLTRAAAYQHNRAMRVYLPGYLLKWVVSTGLTLGVTRLLDSLSDHTGAADVFIVMAAGTGMLVACGICMLLVTGYIYLYLSRHAYI
jgi:hypothetical protein